MKEVIDLVYRLFQVKIPILNISMWNVEIALAVGAIVVQFITSLFDDN